jgi:hypothetical protein
MKKLLLILVATLIMGAGCTQNTDNQDAKIQELENKIANLESDEPLDVTTTPNGASVIMDGLISNTETKDANNESDNNPLAPTFAPVDLSEEYRKALIYYCDNRIDDVNDVNDVINDMIFMIDNRINTMNNLISSYGPYLDPSSELYFNYSDLRYGLELDLIDYRYIVDIASMYKSNFLGYNEPNVTDMIKNSFSEMKNLILTAPVISKNDFIKVYTALNGLSTQIPMLTNDMTGLMNEYTDSMEEETNKIVARHEQLTNDSINIDSLPSTSSELNIQYSIPQINQITCYINDFGSSASIDCYDSYLNKTNCYASDYGTLGIMECY